jgi:hypothetical protein
MEWDFPESDYLRECSPAFLAEVSHLQGTSARSAEHHFRETRRGTPCAIASPARRRRRPKPLKLKRIKNFEGLSLQPLEGPKAGRGRAQEHLPGRRCRGRGSRARRLRGEPLGTKISGDRPELAAGLDRSHPVLRLPRRRQTDFIHDECYRGAQLQAAPSGPGQGPFSQRRGGDETSLPGLEPVREGVDHAAARVGHGQVPVRRPVRRALHNRHGLTS